MSLTLRSAVSACVSIFVAAVAHAAEPLDAEPLFQREVLPVLREKCFGCHGDGKELEGGLDLRSRGALLRGGDSGPALVPKKPRESLLYQAILWDNEELRMPPQARNRLGANEIASIERWIEAGAPWPKARAGKSAAPEDQQAEGTLVSTSGGLSEAWNQRRYKPDEIWAYLPIQRPQVPKGAAHPIDAFLNEEIAEAKLQPAPRTDRRTLVRRATFDLLGLPPRPEDVTAFDADDAPEAFAKLVDRLLASPHYGEQAARHWLDVVRYADTSGFSNDFERPNAWRYRDYVVRSFNADKPFYRFIVEQIAGDELDAKDPELQIAVGYLRMGPWEHTSMSVAAVTRQQFLDDVTHGIGVTFLGQGLRCASCHDHKFDPVPTRDYYRLQAVFAPTQLTDRRVPFLASEKLGDVSEEQARLRRLIAECEATSDAITAKTKAALERVLAEWGVKDIKELSGDEQQKLRLVGLDEIEKSTLKVTEKRKSYLERELKRYEPIAFSVYSGAPRLYFSPRLNNDMPPEAKRRGEAPDVCILTGGALDAPGDKVESGVLSAVAHSNSRAEPSAWNSVPPAVEGRRLALARWIASGENTLTARVIVNRVWQQHFGHGLVATPNNFGKMGARPSHPELLDWLATWFIDHGWSIKGLHRLIMTSDAYARRCDPVDANAVAQADSRNARLSYYPRRRLAAEEIRDAMLAATGELNPRLGGPGVFVELNWEVAMQPRHIMGSVAPAYQPATDPRERHRRTLYAFRIRTLADPMLEVFNQPVSDTSCECRDNTTVTPQVFALFNAQQAHDRALALAARLEREASDRPAQIARAFELVYGRAPRAEETARAVEHVERMTAWHRQHEPQRVDPPRSVRREMIEEMTGEPFIWDEMLDRMKSFQSDLKPWDVGPGTRALAELCLVLFNSNEFLYVR
ncbi:MAG: PSD1 domain-containing protein [Planctomycetes bacterium]|nr:PSD1 domain-containing protein [Planctomycetota bacterium]